MRWYEGPEWAGWDLTEDDWGYVCMSLFRHGGTFGTPFATVESNGCVSLIDNKPDRVAHIKCQNPEQARQIGEAWVKGWTEDSAGGSE